MYIDVCPFKNITKRSAASFVRPISLYVSILGSIYWYILVCTMLINWDLSFYINKLITKCQLLECFLSNSTQYFKWIYIAGKAEGVGTQRRISTFCFFEDMLLFYLQIMLTWSCLYKGHSIKPILVSQKSSWG